MPPFMAWTLLLAGQPRFPRHDRLEGGSSMSETNGSNTQPELTLVQVRDSIRSYVTQGNAGHYSIGQLYNYTVANELAEKEGFASAQEFFSQNFKELAQATLSRYGAVAREFTEEACRKYGVVKLTTLSTYARLEELELASSDLGSLSIDVPQDGGAVAPKPFAECSLEELRLALKHKRKPRQEDDARAGHGPRGLPTRELLAALRPGGPRAAQDERPGQ